MRARRLYSVWRFRCSSRAVSALRPAWARYVSRVGRSGGRDVVSWTRSAPIARSTNAARSGCSRSRHSSRSMSRRRASYQGCLLMCIRDRGHEERYSALHRADAQQYRHPDRGQLLQDRPGQHRPVPRRPQVGRQPHDHGQQRAGARLEAQHPCLRRGVLGRDPALGQVREEVPAAPGRQLLLLPGLHQDDREHTRRPLGRHPVHRQQRRRDPEHHQPRPYRAGAGAAAGDVDHHRVRGRLRLALPAQPLPDLERVRGGLPGHRAGSVQELAVGGLQEHRVRREVGQDAQHLGDPATAEQGLRTAAVDLLGPLEQRVVAVDDLGVDLLRHGHEGDLAVQLDQRQPGRPRRLHEGRREPGEARAQLDHQRRDPPVREAAYEGPLLGGPGAQPQAGGQQQLPALEQGCDVRDLARVHPAHGPAQPVGTGHDLRQPAAQPGQLQRPLNGDPALVLHSAGRYRASRSAHITGRPRSPSRPFRPDA